MLVRTNFKNKPVRGRLKWASHMEKLGDIKMTNTADAQNVEAKRSYVITLSVCDGERLFRIQNNIYPIV